MASNRSRSNRSVGNKLNNLDSRVSKGEKGTNNPHLSPDVIEESHLQDASVAEGKLADRAVTENKIARGAIGTEHLGIVNTLTADSGLTLKPGPDGGFIVIDGPEYVAPATGSGDLYALAFNELNQVVVSTTGVGGGDGVAAMPAGSIQAWPSNTVPDGWLMCDGAAVSRTTYSALFTAIGTTFGVGDNSTTFNVPNIKGRTIVGKDSAQVEFDTLGETGGAKTHTLTTAEIPAHSHTGTTNTDGSHRHWISGAAYDDGNMSTSGSSNTQDYGLAADAGSWTLDDPNKNFGRYSSYTGSTHSHAFTTGTNGGSGGAHNNLQPYIVLNYIIKHMQADGMQGPQGIQGVPGNAATVAVGTTTTGSAGSVATVTNAGTTSAAVLNFTIPRGDTGATGTTGPQGPSGTVAVGSTSTGLEGTDAQVTNSGTSTNAVLEFVIPRGNAATVSVGTTTNPDYGTPASVSNSGDGHAAIFNFAIPKGRAATATAGTTTTLSEDNSATVANAGTTSDAVFNFGVPQGKTGNPAGVKYQFSTTVTDSDPGNGYVRVNNATTGSITSVFIDNLDAGGADQTTWYQQWDDTTNVHSKGYLYLAEYRTNNVLVLRITGTVTGATGYYKVPVTYVSGALPSNNANTFVVYSQSGDQGVSVPASGSTGQILAKTSGADYDFAWIDPELANNVDVDLTLPISDGQALTYDSATGKWINATPATLLDDLTDVALTAPLENGQALTYDTATSTWINATPASTLDDLTDVTLTGPLVDKQVLKYDDATSQWINAVATGGVTVSATAPAEPYPGDAWYDSTDGSMYVYYDDGSAGSAVVTNYFTDPNFVNAPGWGASGVTLSASFLAYSGSKSMRAIASVFSGIAYYTFAGLTPSISYTFSVWIKGESGKTLRLQIQELNSSSAVIGTTNGITEDMTGNWQRLSVTRALSASGVGINAVIENTYSGSHTYYVDAAMLENSGTLHDYFDGSTNGGAWSGTPDASTSTKTVTVGTSAQWVEIKSTAVPTNFSGVEARVTTAESDIDTLQANVSTLQSTQILTSNVNTFTAQQNFSASGTYISGTSGQIVARPSTSTQIPMVVQGATSQSADMQQWLNSSGVVLSEVDSLGRITQSAIPAFSVQGTGTQSWSGGAIASKVLMQGTVFANRGGHYSATNSRFTAPIAGVYQFHMSSCVTSNIGGPEILVYKNGSVLVSNLAIGYDAFYNTFGSSFVLDLSVNDFVEMYINNNNGTAFTIDRGRSVFSGHLIG